MNAKIDCSKIKVGVSFSAPVFFDDGENMFLAANQTAKSYHVAALKRWNIPFLLTSGSMKTASGAVKTPSPAKKPVLDIQDVASIDDIGNVEDLEDVEELEEL